MTTLAQDLGGVVRLLEKAAPGPWIVQKCESDNSLYKILDAAGRVIGFSRRGTGGRQEALELEANSELLVSAANLVRRLAGEAYHIADTSKLVDANERLRDLHDSIRTVYDAVPALPITTDTVDAATDALHAFCLLVGIHRVDVGDPQPQPAMQQGGGGGE